MNEYFAIFDFDILWNPKRLNRTVFLLEFRETGSLLEESIERSIYVLNGAALGTCDGTSFNHSYSGVFFIWVISF